MCGSGSVCVCVCMFGGGGGDLFLGCMCVYLGDGGVCVGVGVRGVWVYALFLVIRRFTILSASSLSALLFPPPPIPPNNADGCVASRRPTHTHGIHTHIRIYIYGSLTRLKNKLGGYHRKHMKIYT
jgi:hypothetical protein